MNQGTEQTEATRPQARSAGSTCTSCDGDIGADPAQSGLNCARCGQWHVLCADCTPNVSEHSRDAAWTCPSCRARPLDA
jgi:DNA-directed RNA polymerase subunit RPC12/RpoP